MLTLAITKSPLALEVSGWLATLPGLLLSRPFLLKPPSVPPNSHICCLYTTAVAPYRPQGAAGVLRLLYSLAAAAASTPSAAR